MSELLNGIEMDTKIQRYMDLSKFMDIIENNQFFFCRINNFKDKLEGASTPLNDIFYSGVHLALGNLANNVLPSLGQETQEDKKLRQKRINQYEIDSKNRSLTTVFGEIHLSEKQKHTDVLRGQKKLARCKLLVFTREY